LQLQVAAVQGQRRIEPQCLHEHQQQVFPRPVRIGVAPDVLMEAQGLLLLEVWPSRSSVRITRLDGDSHRAWRRPPAP
jgi:hypothetical protein